MLSLDNKFKSDSCGTSDYHIGELPDERTLKCAKKHNIPIRHRGRQINRVDIREFDYLIAMDSSNKEIIQNLINGYGMEHHQLFLIREFQTNPDHIEVPDPYYGGDEGFENIYEILDDSIDGFLEHLKIEHHIYV